RARGMVRRRRGRRLVVRPARPAGIGDGGQRVRRHRWRVADAAGRCMWRGGRVARRVAGSSAGCSRAGDDEGRPDAGRRNIPDLERARRAADTPAGRTQAAGRPASACRAGALARAGIPGRRGVRRSQPTAKVFSHGGVIVRSLSILILLAIVAAIAWAGITYVHFTRTPLNVRTTGQTLEIAKGEGFGGIVAQLRQKNLSDAQPLLWRALAWRLGVANRLHAGEYALAPGMTPMVLLENMAAGRVLHHRVTLVDGWTFAQVRQALQKAPKLAHDIDGLSDEQVMARLDDASQSPEGEFMPDTYDYVLGMSDLDVLARAHKATQLFLADEWARRDTSISIQQPYQALILASLVEKETAVPAERPEIAGVFERRLKLGMKL